MSAPLVIQCEELDDDAAAWLGSRCTLERCPPEDARFASLLRGAAGLVVRTYTKVNDAMLDAYRPEARLADDHLAPAGHRVLVHVSNFRAVKRVNEAIVAAEIGWIAMLAAIGLAPRVLGRVRRVDRLAHVVQQRRRQKLLVVRQVVAGMVDPWREGRRWYRPA